jgi:S1-C subfamily serine protease
MATRRRIRVLRLPLLLLFLAILAYARWQLNRDPAPKEWMTTPGDQEALHSLQERIQSATGRVMSAVVAIKEAHAATSSSETPRVSEPYASGVIITADGLILSQFHVSHRLAWKPGEPVRSRQPRERTMVILSDGHRIEAELLGADSTFDLSLLHLLEPGPYPHATLDPSSKVGIGDWVLKLGHPMGYRRDRPPVVRLGRVLFQNKDIFVTDCLMTGGDSGGPFFDLEGTLVGIVHSAGAPAKLANSLTSFRPGSDRIGPFSSTTNRFIQQRLDAMLRREIAPFDEKLGQRFQESYRRVDDDEILPRDQWTQGAVIARVFHDVIGNPPHTVVTILDEAGNNVAQGTIVESDGWIVTMASSLPANPRCRFSDAKVAAAQVVGMDPAFDLALLRVEANDLPAVRWAGKPPLVAGTMVAAFGMSKLPLSIGIVSVPQRNLPGPFPVRVSRGAATRPEVSGKPTKEGYLVVSAWGEAASAGIQPGAVILTIAGRKVRNEQDLLDASRGHVEGERVPVCLLKGDQRQNMILRLVAEPKPFAGFPTLFEHDMPLARDQCGGPVVNLAGDVIGVTLRRGQYGCMAIPSDCVRQLLPVLKHSSLSDKWIKPPPASPN